MIALKMTRFIVWSFLIELTYYGSPPVQRRTVIIMARKRSINTIPTDHKATFLTFVF